MKSSELIHATGNADMTAKQLQHAMSFYVNVTYKQVRDYILDGVSGYHAKVIAFILGLKKYFPEGWKPEEIKIRATPRQLVMGVTHDITRPDTLTGKEHPNYKNGTHIRSQKIARANLDRKKGITKCQAQ